MLTEPMGLNCEFCGKSPFIKNREEFERHYKQAVDNNLKKKLSQLQELKHHYITQTIEESSKPLSTMEQVKAHIEAKLERNDNKPLRAGLEYALSVIESLTHGCK